MSGFFVFHAPFTGDLGASTVREAIVHRATPHEQFQDVWVYGVDAALTPACLLAAEALDGSPWSGFALVPRRAARLRERAPGARREPRGAEPRLSRGTALVRSGRRSAALSAEVAAQEMGACSGSQFDPGVVDPVLAEVAPEAVLVAADASAVPSRALRSLAAPVRTLA